MDWEDTRCQQEHGRTNYFLGELQQMVLRGRETFPKDYPLPLEEAMTAALVAAFKGTYEPALAYLIETGELDDIIKLSLNPDTGVFDPFYLTAAFRRYFGDLWFDKVSDLIKETVDEMWELADEYMDEEVEGYIDPEHKENREEEARYQIIAMGALGATLGATDQIILPTATTAASQAYLHGMTSTEMVAAIKAQLQTETLGRSLVYYDNISTALVNRTRNMGRLFRADRAGLLTMYWVTAGDEKVCPRCDLMDGMEFNVPLLMAAVDRFIDANSNQEAIDALPWPSSRGSDFVLPSGDLLSMESSAEEFAASGIGVPPLHPRCRCTLEIGVIK